MNGNLGAWDTLAAVQWTKEHISKFGGDPDSITVIGQSAGAGIITWLLLGEDGNLDLPFDQAWITSPAIPPRNNLERSRPIFNTILDMANCSDVECLRGISQVNMRDLNSDLLSLPGGGGGGQFGPGVGLGPTVDGELLSDLPVNLFEAGKANKKVKQVVVGNTAKEVSVHECHLINSY